MIIGFIIDFRCKYGNFEEKCMKTSSKNDSNWIKDLENKITQKDKEIKELRDDIIDLRELLGSIMDDKRELEKKVNKYELSDIESEMQKNRKIEEDYYKIKHRCKVTKKLLDETRLEVNKMANVIADLEKRTLMDQIRGRFPESYLNYLKNRDKLNNK